MDVSRVERLVTPDPDSLSTLALQLTTVDPLLTI